MEARKIKLRELLSIPKSKDNVPVNKSLPGHPSVTIYPNSIREKNNVVLFIAKELMKKFLFLCYEDIYNSVPEMFEGAKLESHGDREFHIKKCLLTTHNRKAIQTLFPFTVPVKVGLSNSFGYGDRLGLANPAHLRSVMNFDFIPVLAQQSIRELTRTNRTPSEVMDASIWAVFQEGYEDGFGADADHLKTKADIDLMIENSFTMFTFDPGEYVINEADQISEKELDEKLAALNWAGLNSIQQELMNDYSEKEFILSEELTIKPDTIALKRALVKYGNAIAHINELYNHLIKSYPDYKSEVEISVDETESVTTPFEHFFFAKELNRLGVKFISLAPRFIGDFEKGIDYKGDLDLFKQEYLKHLAITKYFGNYKISLHSGSDKFSVYKVIGSIKGAYTHIKTAGTSYLEALKVTAIKKPDLFREILNYCVSLYEHEKKTYHVSAQLSKIKPAEEYADNELEPLFYDDNVRQVLHVTFGRVLTDKTESGEFVFKDRLFECLIKYESTYYEVLQKHFYRHLEPFK